MSQGLLSDLAAIAGRPPTGAPNSEDGSGSEYSSSHGTDDETPAISHDASSARSHNEQIRSVRSNPFCQRPSVSIYKRVLFLRQRSHCKLRTRVSVLSASLESIGENPCSNPPCWRRIARLRQELSCFDAVVESSGVVLFFGELSTDAPELASFMGRSARFREESQSAPSI